MSEWYKIDNVDSLDTPALVIYPERVKANLEILKSFVRNMSQVRPHIKTNKCPQVVRLMLDAGIVKFKCATIAEAEMLAMEGAKDILLAYQPTGPKARRFCQLQQKYQEASFSCLVDNSKTLAELSAVAGEYDQDINMFVDLNVGMNRTGITPGQEALNLCQDARKANGIVFLGLHAYDGHLRDRDLNVRRAKCDDAFRPVEEMRAQLVRDSGKEITVVAGGTPTFPIHAGREGVEASPGTFIFWDQGYDRILPEQPFEFAALVVTRVISVPDDHTFCLDLGHKSIASENPIENRVYLLNASGEEPVGHSEEHMVFRSNNPHGYQTGHVFYGVPHHICPTVALYDEARVCSDHKVNDTWPILARKRKITV
ncbi:MAG: D-TA family PLP-dependent enzyme [Bacteroidota bacterium]|nr:D-TA family PLP-dependent enzyme [Bacteroidota bacterium]